LFDELALLSGSPLIKSCLSACFQSSPYLQNDSVTEAGNFLWKAVEAYPLFAIGKTHLKLSGSLLA
jgi:hypothetical protein